MSHFDELPRRSESQRTEGISRSAFHSAVTEYGLFEIKAENLDYGIDFELEAVDNRYQVTNARAAVQLKGTKCRLKENGSVAVRIKLRNLNYILMRRAGLFVCYHLPTKRLMAQTADAVAGSYGQSGKAWFKQESVTVTFKDAFDEAYQRRLRDWLLAFHRQERDRRVNRAGTPRAALGAVLESLDSSPIIPFELDPAKETLQGLYNSAQDSAISKSFDQFRAVLPHGELLTAYVAEINLGMAGHRCDRKRIRDGIEALSACG
ncbi:MAG: DUF4365 domain-containing protein [Bacteroidota bacterium]|nr:DUF4365 domain-containing protein [Bacteroidota bacterium]